MTREVISKDDTQEAQEINRKDPQLQDKMFKKIKNAWNILSSYLIVGLITALIGVAIGVKVSQKYYSDKMNDCTISQGLVYKGKAYNLIPK